MVSVRSSPIGAGVRLERDSLAGRSQCPSSYQPPPTAATWPRHPIRWLTAAILCAWAISAVEATESIWDAVRAPGSVVVLRHSFAPGGFDPPDARLDDCSTQRNLDERGRAQAQRIGEAFRQRGVTVGTVLSSPRCRCLDTGRLAFGRAEPWDPLQGALNDTERRRRQLTEIKSAIAAHRSAPPLVLVTHGSVVTDLTGLGIQMGAFVVLRRGPDGSHAVAGQLYVD
jgi:phosphohistidine phosphatase SixA